MKTVNTKHRARFRFDWAVEKLLPGELADRFTLTHRRYGRTLELVLFGRRLIVDVSHK